MLIPAEAAAQSADRVVVAQGDADVETVRPDDLLGTAGMSGLRMGYRFSKSDEGAWRRVDVAWTPLAITCPDARLRIAVFSGLAHWADRSASVSVVIEPPGDGAPNTMLRGTSKLVDWADVLPGLSAEDAQAAFAAGFTITGLALRSVELDRSLCTEPLPLPPEPPPRAVEPPPTDAVPDALVDALLNRAIVVDLAAGGVLRGVLLGGNAESLVLALPDGAVQALGRSSVAAIRLDTGQPLSPPPPAPEAVVPLPPAAPSPPGLGFDVLPAPQPAGTAPTPAASIAPLQPQTSPPSSIPQPTAAAVGAAPAAPATDGDPRGNVSPLLYGIGGGGMALGLLGVVSGTFIWGGPAVLWSGVGVSALGAGLVITGAALAGMNGE